MAKISSYTVVIGTFFIVGLLFIIIFPIESLVGKGVEQVYQDNKGLLYFMGLIVGICWVALTLILNMFSKELNEKNETISIQNGKIIHNQESHLIEIKELNRSINRNSEKDIKTLEAIQKQNVAIDAILRRVGTIENEVKKIHNTDKRLSSIEKLIKIHDKDIDKLKVA